MTDSPILPGDKYWIDASRRPLPPEFFRFFRSLLAYVQQTQGASVELAELTARVDALEAGGSADLLGPLSVMVSGSLDSGAVQFRLVNDSGNPGASFYYGTDASGDKGWNLLAMSALADVDLTGLADGDTLLWDATGMQWLPGGILSNPMTTAGDIIVGLTGGTPDRLPAGSEGHVLTIVSGVPAYAPGGGGGGALTYLGEVVVSTAQQDIDFSGLGLEAAGIYQIELVHVANATSAATISLYYNGDLTAGNYQSQYWSAFGSSTFQDRASNARIALDAGTVAVGAVLTSTIKISKLASRRPQALAETTGNDGSNIFTQRISHTRTNTADVTSIKLRSSGLFAIGSRARLYALS